MTNQPTKPGFYERPDRPGLWHREGKNYCVWMACGSLRYEEFSQDFAAKTGGEVSWLPTGNWQPLVVPVTREEAKKELHEWISLNMLGSGYDRLVNKAAEIFAGVQGESTYRKLYEHAIECVDRVFQECTENPKPILPDFLGIGDDKFDGVVKLAEKYREQSDKITTVTAKLEKYKRVLIENQDFCGAAAVKDCLQLLNGFEPKLLSETEDQITDLKATIARLEGEVENLKTRIVGIQAEQFVTNAEARELQDVLRTLTPSGTALKTSACELVKMLQELKEKATSAPPEVIEGRGQAVTREGVYAALADDADATDTWDCCPKEVGDSFCEHNSYIYIGPIPIFPPRATFTPPPKPELVLVRWHRPNGGHVDMWTTKTDSLGGGYRGIEDGCTYTRVELLDETTGEVRG